MKYLQYVIVALVAVGLIVAGFIYQNNYLSSQSQSKLDQIENEKLSLKAELEECKNTVTTLNGTVDSKSNDLTATQADLAACQATVTTSSKIYQVQYNGSSFDKTSMTINANDYIIVNSTVSCVQFELDDKAVGTSLIGKTNAQGYGICGSEYANPQQSFSVKLAKGTHKMVVYGCLNTQCLSSAKGTDMNPKSVSIVVK
jgi:hypothetical protein